MDKKKPPESARDSEVHFLIETSRKKMAVVTAVIALYFNCFVLIAQSFLKIPALHALAPKGNEPPFAIAQGILLVLFIMAGVLAVKKFRPDAAMSAARAASGAKS
jgi:hypothetical protein